MSKWPTIPAGVMGHPLSTSWLRYELGYVRKKVGDLHLRCMNDDCVMVNDCRAEIAKAQLALDTALVIIGREVAREVG